MNEPLCVCSHDLDQHGPETGICLDFDCSCIEFVSQEVTP